MNGRPVLRMAFPVLGALTLALLATTVDARERDEVFFFDDFNGSSLDASKWNTSIAISGIRYAYGVWTMPPAESNYGSVTVGDSRLTLDNPSPTLSYPIFPLLWSNDAIPPTGDFELEFRMRYTNGGFWGDGVRIVWMPTGFEPALGSTESAEGIYALMVHQDNLVCRGPNVSVHGNPGVDGSVLPFDTKWHTYTLKYEGDASTVYVDGAHFAGPLPAPRPNCIQLGVGEVKCCAEECGCCGCWWTSYDIDYMKVTVLRPTSVRSRSWGALKARYR